jgi:predicted alpha/beta hydrolase
VATEWARWCRHPEYLAGYYPEAHRRFARFDSPSLFYSMTDDALAPEAAVRSLLEALPSHTVHHRRIRPEELGVRDVGHFGFFRGDFSGTLWREARQFLGQALAGREPVVPEPPSPLPSDPFGGVSLEEIMTDLEYGRA